VLAQDDKKENKRIIAYKARRLNAVKKNYLIIEKKCLAVV